MFTSVLVAPDVSGYDHFGTEVWEPGCVKCGRQGACNLLTEWATRCKGGQGANKSGQRANKAGQGASKAGQGAAPG